jgi:hypothetical protein
MLTPSEHTGNGLDVDKAPRVISASFPAITADAEIEVLQ